VKGTAVELSSLLQAAAVIIYLLAGFLVVSIVRTFSFSYASVTYSAHTHAQANRTPDQNIVYTTTQAEESFSKRRQL
jgi:hypothetical protein